MRYRPYGKTGKQVSVIGFGGMRFPEDEDQAVRVMVRAAELGINYFDTAPGYCKDRSEPIFGRALRAIDRPVYVSTKSSIGEEKDADAVMRRVENALERMGLETLTFFNMWCLMNWEHFEKVMAKGGPYEGAMRAKEQGLVEHVVFSTHANGREIRRMCESGAFEGVTLGYNILNHKNRGEGIRAAAEQEMGVVIMNPLGGGMIPAGAERFDFLRRGSEDSVVQASLRFLVSHPEITVTLVGIDSIEHLEENVRAGEAVEAPSRQTVQAIMQQYESLGESFCTGCKYCLPCPEEIRIPSILACLNRLDLGMEREGHGLYRWFRRMAKDEWKAPESCVECGVCEERCTQRLPVSSLILSCQEKLERPAVEADEERAATAGAEESET